ncbi:hypothetical protein [Shimia biformata]|uniref:hypothetical protein n=1 Tax=Shimia biformata TaxID=1294299 RepID=UPI00194F717A|nr:hypothetical protein [Shimia biformata]
MLLLLKLVHFLAFSIAVGASLANVIAGKRLAPLMPEGAASVIPFRARLGQIATICLIALWLSGLALVATTHGAGLWSNGWFLLKIALVLALTAVSAILNLAAIKANKTGTPPDPQRMMKLGVAGHALALSIVVAAVVTFA